MHPPSPPAAAPSTTPDDACFVQYVASRDASLLDRLLHAHAPRALAQARRLLGPGPDAEDAVQEAFLQLVRTAERYRGQVPFGPWLGRLVHLACLRLRRTRRRQGRERSLSAGTAAPAVSDGATVDSERLRLALGELPERDQLALSLHYFAACDLEATARTLGISPNAAAVRLHRARERLRQRMQASWVSDVSIVLALTTPAAVDSAVNGITHVALARLQGGHPLPPTLLQGTPGPFAAALHGAQLVLSSLATGALIAAAASPLRLIAADAPPPAATAPVAMDAAGLVRLQRADGSWSDATIGSAPADLTRDAHATAMATLALLGAGADPSLPGPYQQAVVRALAWIQGHEQPDGTFPGGSREQALLTMTLAEAVAVHADAALRVAARRGLQVLLHQPTAGPGGAQVWTDANGVVSTRTMTIIALCCRSAQLAGMDEAQTGLRLARQWMEATWREVGNRAPTAPFPAAIAPDGHAVAGRGSDVTDALMLAYMASRASSILNKTEGDALHAALVAALVAQPVPTAAGLDTSELWLRTMGLFTFQDAAHFNAWEAPSTTALQAGVIPSGAQQGMWHASRDPDSLSAGPVSASAGALLMQEVFLRWKAIGDPTKQQFRFEPAPEEPPVAPPSPLRQF